MGVLFQKRFGIRSKLVLLSVFLLVIPWLGYRYILEMEEYLRRGQEQVTLGTAQALATALSERPELFSDSIYSRGNSNSADLYVYPVFYPLAIEDGNLLDWGDYQIYEKDYREIPPEITGSDRTGDALSFQLMLAEHNRSLFVYVKVQDRNLVLRSREGLRVDRSDSLRLSLITRDGTYERYVVSPYEDEFIYPYRIGTEISDVSSLEYEPRITGRWNQTAEGYEVEFRLPLELIGDHLGIGIVDVDDAESRIAESYVFTSGIDNPLKLGSLQRPTPEIDRIIAGMGHTNSRIQVVDASQRMLLSVGDIQTATGLVLGEEDTESSGLWGWIENTLLHPLYYQVLSKPTTDFVDDLYQQGIVDGEHINSALQGIPLTRFREIEDSQQNNNAIRILEAAYPVLANGEVLGAVLVDQNMNGIRTFRNQAMEALFNTMLTILALTVFALFLFASSLSMRLRTLRNQAEKILDDSGRLTNTITPSRSSDEIGDLSRSFSHIVERLGQYTNYLENMSSRLSHELRTPVTVVRSSLENLRMASNEDEAKVYITRAEDGIKRLNMILTNMSEAARLENILLDSDKELTDVGKVVNACMEGYEQIYPNQPFEVVISRDDLVILGGADYLAQMLDKLIANAVDFSLPGVPIRVECYREEDEVVLSIINNGEYLSEAMKDRIFDSMVSVRPQHKQQQPHLGMGLHIVKMITDFHNGYVFADNLIQEEGVMVTVRLPTYDRPSSI